MSATPAPPQPSRLLRQPEVLERVNWSATTLWRREREGKFPKRRRVGPNIVGWLESEIDEWIENLPLAGGTNGDPPATSCAR